VDTQKNKKVSSLKCLRPTKFPNSHLHVPCGTCMPCRVKRKREWQTKLMLESKYHNNFGMFVTLTYNEENLPEKNYYNGGNLSKKHLQLFIKRYRKATEQKIRYFAVGEYGTESQRAHYHICIFNDEVQDHDNYKSMKGQCNCKLCKKWEYGAVHVGTLEDESIGYTVGYAVKKMTSQKDFNDERQPEFTLMSRKPLLGYHMIDSFVELIKKANIEYAKENKILIPMNYGTDWEKFLLDRTNYFQDQIVVPWNGMFILGSTKNGYSKIWSFRPSLFKKDFGKSIPRIRRRKKILIVSI
jgi:hypothetical protein